MSSLVAEDNTHSLVIVDGSGWLWLPPSILKCFIGADGDDVYHKRMYVYRWSSGGQTRIESLTPLLEWDPTNNYL